LLSIELAPEALGALRVAAINQPLLANDSEFRLMRAAANLMMGRVVDARADLSAAGLADDPSAALWRGYAAVLQENWAAARRELEAGRDALHTQTGAWRVRFRLALAEAALRQGDLAVAGGAADDAMGEAGRPDLQLQARLLKARYAAAIGDTQPALAEFESLSKAPDEAIAVRAALESIRLKRQTGKITPKEAADKLEALRYRWRGDALELETIQTLGHTYADLGQWRQGLAVMASASATFPKNPATRRMRIDMGAIFERLFLGGDADKLEPIQALGLFYEFKELTPYGPDGDRLVRMLAGRLVKVDLLEQAAELLRHQVENRLEGLGQAQIALDLAAIYLDDKKADKALAVLNETRQAGLPQELIAARRIVEATALLQLGRYDHAVEIVEKDRIVEAQRIRAESAWRRRDWGDSLRTLQPLMPPPRGDAPMTPEERAIVLRAGIAAVFADDRAAMAQLARTYGARMQSTPDGAAFDVVTGAADAGDARLREAARAIARTDLMDRFMKATRERLTAPAAPAAPAPDKTAATARPPAG
jgi:tetratricopeptide (TPR) repeat protein